MNIGPTGVTRYVSVIVRNQGSIGNIHAAQNARVNTALPNSAAIRSNSREEMHSLFRSISAARERYRKNSWWSGGQPPAICAG